MERPHIPSFGEWNFYTEQVPVMQTGPVQETGQDLFYVSSPSKLNYHYKQREEKNGEVDRRYTRSVKGKTRKEVRRGREVAIKPVDEDLYKIPAELLPKKPIRSVHRSFSRSWLTGCIGLGCFA